MSADFRRRHSLEVEDELSEIGRDEDADREHYEEERQERFRRDIDRHIFGRGGKLKLKIAKTRLALRDEQNFNQTMKKLRVMEKPGASARSNRLDTFYDNSPEHLKRIKTHGMGSQEADATSDYVSQGTEIRPPKPTQKERARIIQAKIKQARNNTVEKLFADRFDTAGIDEYIDGGALIRDDGKILRPSGEYLTTHYEIARDFNPHLGVAFKNPKPKDPEEPQQMDDEDVHNFLKATNTVRLQSAGTNPSVHIGTRLTSAQIKTLKDLEEFHGNVDYAIGDDYNNMVFGGGFRNLVRDHAKLFGQKQAQEEDTNVNMTYTKSKKVKLLKKMFRDQRTAKAEESIALFKQQKLGPEHEEGFGFDPRHGDFVTPQAARERYGKPGVALHFIATTDNAGPVENISRALDVIGDNHFIGGWKSSTGFKTDASYIINTNDQQEVITHLKRHNQEASYSIDASGNPYFIRNPHFVKH